MKRDSQEFKMRLYEQIKRLFPEDEIELLVARAAGPAGSGQPFDPAVRIVHKPTGKSVECNDFPSQVENRIIATLELRIACDKGTA